MKSLLIFFSFISLSSSLQPDSLTFWDKRENITEIQPFPNLVVHSE